MLTNLKYKWQFSFIGKQCANIRRHKIMVALIIILTAITLRLFTSNYRLQMPFIKLDNYNAELQTSTDLTACLSSQAIQANDASIQANNPDLYR